MKINDQLLDRFESSIRRLKLDYDIFFNGGAERFPQKLHEELTREVRRLFTVQSFTYAQRFRLNSLASRLSVYNDLWQRNLRLVEQGLKPTYGIRPDPSSLRRIEVPIAAEDDREAIDTLLQAFCRARESAGEDAPIDPLKFEELVIAKLRQAQKEVVFIVTTEEGEVHLRTRVRQ